MSPWLGFWERANRIYVNDRHRAVHYRQVADDILSILPPGSDSIVLDYGCGEALEAPRVAARVERLYLFDAVQTVQEKLRARFLGHDGIVVLDAAALASLAPGTLDRIVVNSVLQYVPRSELPALLAGWHRALKPGGMLILADVIPPDVGAVADVKALLGTALGNGFFFAALIGLFATFSSEYRRLRAKAGLSTYRETEMLTLLREAGFSARRRMPNFGINPARMTFLAEQSADSSLTQGPAERLTPGPPSL